jgi:hypothetical protein
MDRLMRSITSAFGWASPIPSQTPPGVSRLLGRLNKAGSSLAAAALLLVTASVAHAGAPEISALLTALRATTGNPTITLSQATSAQLSSAVIAAIQLNVKLNPGTIAGEALKAAGSPAPDAGAQIASAILAQYPTSVPFGTKPLTLQLFATQAIKTTATGTGLTVAQVPGFSAAFYATDAEAIALAGLVKASKVAASAVLQGRASEEASDSAKLALAQAALLDKNLAALPQEVVTGVAAAIDPASVSSFTNALVTTPSNLKNVLKIIPGIVAGQPTSAGLILSTSFTALPGAASPVVKGAAALAKSIGAVADIEQIQRVGAAIATQVGNGSIKYSGLAAIATTLAKAIVSKPLAVVGANRNANKVDELGELAAYMLSAVVTTPDFLKAPDKNVVALIKAIVAGSKSATGPSVVDIASYVTGSIARTVAALAAAGTISAAASNSIVALLNNPATAKSIGGAALASIVTDAINQGLAGSNGFENGTDTVTGGLTDAETNSRGL